jgi:hypothetical protein
MGGDEMKNLPSFHTYGNYRSDNYGAHCLCFAMPGLTVWFSYQTPIAFRSIHHNGYEMVVRENDWGPTTGKHLNWIDDGNKDSRIPGDEFEKLLSGVMSQSGKDE